MKKMIILLLVTLQLSAQNTVQTKEESLQNDPLFHANRKTGLSLYDAVTRAILQSPKLEAAQQYVIQEKQNVREAEAGHLPVVNISGDAGYENRETSPDTSDPLSTGTSYETLYHYKKTELFATITQNLWAGYSIENAINEKDANLKAALFDYRDQLEQLVIDITNAYFDVVYNEIALKISQKNMKNYEKILKIVTIKEKNGAATKGDVNFIRANVDNARTALVQNQKALNDALSKYTYLLQTEDKEMLPYETMAPLYIADLNTSLQDADHFNAKLLRQKAYIKASKFGFLTRKGDFQPRVDFTINAESRNEFDVGLGKRDKVNALVTFNYNLYNGGKDEAKAIRYLAKLKEQKYLYSDLQRNLVFDIKVLNQAVGSLQESLKLTESEVLSARKVVNSYWIAFQHGTQDLQALQLAQRNLNSAELNYALYKKNLLVNNFELMRKTGVLLQLLSVKYKKDASEFPTDANIFYNFNNLK